MARESWETWDMYQHRMARTADAYWKSSSRHAFPEDVPGWLTKAEGGALHSAATGKRVLEIGSYLGRSTICLAYGAERVVNIDAFDGRNCPPPAPTLAAFDANLVRYGVREKVSTWIGTPEDHLGDNFPHNVQPFGLAFIDGDHRFLAVLRDARLCQRHLQPEGLLAFHDYMSPRDPGVAVAVHLILALGGEMVDTVGTVAFVRAPAEPIPEVEQNPAVWLRVAAKDGRGILWPAPGPFAPGAAKPVPSAS